ncbi:MAG: hypothetical protein LW710_14995, partial [Burkholderiales bacterium]|uniref:hypothetical protein n=1 Tax=Limnobacter sp. TaxID=2003368 RepID=UPI0039BC2723|nr:hypothetical protein [Burkholderiales bacterium]
SLPYLAAKDIDLAWFQEGENIRVADTFVVDILLNANGYTFDALLADAQIVDLMASRQNHLPSRSVAY